MKKLLIFLALLSAVVDVNASTITRRIWAYCDWGGKWQSTDKSIRIHYFKSDGTDIDGHNWEASNSQYMTRFNSSNWFFYDITADESDLSSVKAIIRANEGDEQTYIYGTAEEIMNLVDNCYKLKVEYASEKNRATVSELKYYLLDTSTSERVEMATEDCCDFTVTIDNQTSTKAGFYNIAPSFAFSDDFSTVHWPLVFRPWNEHQVLDFENVSDRTYFAADGNSNSWQTNNVPAKFNITLHTLTWKYDVSSSFTRTIGQYGTFSSNYNVAIPSGLKAYYASSKSGDQITMTKFTNGISSSDGAFIQAENGTGDTYTFTPAASTDSHAANYLKKGTSDFTGGENCYVFAKQGGVFGFYKYNSSAVDLTGKAYLDVTGAGARLNLVFDDSEATGIANVREVANNKQFFNLNGQRVAQPQKGLYIVNGKKMIMK